MNERADAPAPPDPAFVTRRYSDEEVTVRIRGLDGRRAPMLHIEHKDGAALIVPECDRTKRDGRTELSTRGFDGTVFRLVVDEDARRLEVEASSATAILGGRLQRTLVRGEDVVPSPATNLRITGDEVTMPLGMGRPE